MKTKELIQKLMARDDLEAEVTLMLDVVYPSGAYSIGSHQIQVYESFRPGGVAETTILGTVRLVEGKAQT